MSNVAYCGDAIGIDWMTRAELSEAIPPAYTRFVGGHLMEALNG
jgi:DNA (cytosine-5)-methyltransferase 1